ncbi:TPA: hypothetical protein ACYQHB_002051, partial [Streptococcus pneumoniae]
KIILVHLVTVIPYIIFNMIGFRFEQGVVINLVLQGLVLGLIWSIGIFVTGQYKQLIMMFSR